MMIPIQLLRPPDVRWLVESVAAERESHVLVTEYSFNPRRNLRQNLVVSILEREAHWRGCHVQVLGRRKRRLPLGRRPDLTIVIEPPPEGPDVAGAMIPRRPVPEAPDRSQRLQPPD